MEIRKIQKTGVSTMTVSLPKGWVQEQGLKQGDPIELEVLTDGSLSLKSASAEKDEPIKKVIHVDDVRQGEHLMRKLIAAYLAGYGIIEVRSKERFDYELKKVVKDFSRLAIGPEVIEETGNSLMLHDLSDPGELPQKKCVRRMHLLVKSMHTDAMDSLQVDGDSLSRDVIDRDLDVDRLYLMVAKQYNMILKDRKVSERIGVDVFEGVNLMLAARLIERIGDHAEKIAHLAAEAREDQLDPDTIEELNALSRKALHILDEAVDSLFKMDIEEANSVIDQGSKLVEECEEKRPGQSTEGYSGVLQNSILDSILRTVMYSMDIGETTINVAIREKG
ncbi:MAG: PhoU domain-containing protein [Methanomassiliicoccales archaeon]